MGIKIAGASRTSTGVSTVGGKVNKDIWSDVGSVITRRVAFMQIYGETGTGRTSVALTAPGPVALMHADEKLDGIIEPFVAQGKKVRTFNFGGTFTGSPEQIARQADEKYREFMAAWVDAFTWAKTIILDTHTELWELLRLARFGKVAQVKPIHYGPVNAEWQSIFKHFRRQESANLIAIGKLREKYVNDKATGIMEQAGQKEFNYLGDIRVRMDKDYNKKKGETIFTGTIEKGWFNAAVEGLELGSDQLQWGELLEMITGMPAEEWEG